MRATAPCTSQNQLNIKQKGTMSVMHPAILGGDWFQHGVLVKAPRSSKDFVLWNQLLLIKIYLPQPVMKLIQHIFTK